MWKWQHKPVQAASVFSSTSTQIGYGHWVKRQGLGKTQMSLLFTP